jgi:hypothetical protein
MDVLSSGKSGNLDPVRMFLRNSQHILPDGACAAQDHELSPLLREIMGWL